MASIGGDIISTLSIGSGIQSNSIVDQLTEIERAPKQTRIDDKRDKYESQISDIGTLKSALSTLQEAADALSDPLTFSSKTASYNDTTAVLPKVLDEQAAAGQYDITVSQLATAHTLSIGSARAFSDPADEVGKGTLTFTFGEWTDSDTFTTNGDLAAVEITIDDTNNSLNGLRDAINEADMGVQASIINDGVNGYKLIVKADSGAETQMRIAVSEDETTPTNTDDSGLSRFSFIEGAANQQLDQLKGGKDAIFTVNNLTVQRSTNTITDVIDGFEFTLAAENTGETFSIEISEDRATAEEAVRGFVDTYNAFFEAVDPLTSFNEATDTEAGYYGSLYRDSTTSALLTSLRQAISRQIDNIGGGYDALTNVGIRTNLDGSISINEDDFRKAFDENFDLVRELFTPQTSSSNDKITVTGYGDSTVTGSYDIAITTPPSQGVLAGAAVANDPLAALTTPTAGSLVGAAASITPGDFDAGTSVFDITIDGTDLTGVTIAAGTYTTEAEVATAIQTAINGAGAPTAVSVAWNGSAFEITSGDTGNDSAITGFSATAGSASALQLATTDGATETSGAMGTGDYSFIINVDGTSSGTINVDYGSYSSYSDIAEYLQSQINGDSALSAARKSVSVEWNASTGGFDITSSAYGSSSKVSVLNIGADAADLGLSTGTSTAGVNVVGTIDGEAGFGSGNVFLPKLDTDPYGLKFRIAEGATTATVNFSRGFGGEFSSLIDSYLQSGGIFANKIDNLNTRLDKLDDDEKALDRRMEAFSARMLAQFQAMERIVNSLNSNGGALDDLAKRLPFTSGN